MLIPELGLLKSLFLSAGAGSCHRVKQTQMLLSPHARGVHSPPQQHQWVPPALALVWEGPRRGVCGVLRQGHFLQGFGKYPSLPRKAAEVQTAQVADALR